MSRTITTSVSPLLTIISFSTNYYIISRAITTNYWYLHNFTSSPSPLAITSSPEPSPPQVSPQLIISFSTLYYIISRTITNDSISKIEITSFSTIYYIISRTITNEVSPSLKSSPSPLSITSSPEPSPNKYLHYWDHLLLHYLLCHLQNHHHRSISKIAIISFSTLYYIISRTITNPVSPLLISSPSPLSITSSPEPSPN